MKIFRRLQTADSDLTKVQNAVEQVINPIAKIPFLDGTELKNIALLSATALKVEHQLGRQPVGFFVTDINAAANIYRTGWTATTITLATSANCTCNIWVY